MGGGLSKRLSRASISGKAGDIDDNDILFRTILMDDESRASLLSFLQFEHAEENLTFYEAVENLKLIESVQYADADPDADFFEGFRKIMRQHVDPGCPQEVNIPQLLAQKLIEIKDGKHAGMTRALVTKELEKAEKEVVGMIAGVFPRWEKHVIFKEYMDNAIKKTTSRRKPSQKPGLGAPSVANLAEGDEELADVKTGMRMLLVEKHELTGVILSRLFMNKGYDVHVSRDGEAALEILDSGEFHWILASTDLTNMTANVFLDSFRKIPDCKSKKAKCICMMSDPSKTSKKSALDAGYIATIQKPFSMDDFETVRNSLSGTMTKVMNSIRQSFAG